MATILKTPTVLIKTKEAYALWFKILTDFPKIQRYNLGGKIEEHFLELLQSIFTALYSPPDKKYYQLTAAVVKLDGLKLFLQLAWENKCLTNQYYTDLSERLEEIGRMLGGWRKGLINKTPPPNRGGEKQ